MESENIVGRLNHRGKELLEMFQGIYPASTLTQTQIERILSFQDRIIAVTDNQLSGHSSDKYPKRFKIQGKGKHRGYLDTAKFWKTLSSNPNPNTTRTTQEESIAQA